MDALALPLAAGDGPATDLVDASLDLVRGGLRQGRAAAGLAQVVVDDAVRLVRAVAPRADQAVEFLAQRGERLAADRRRGRRRGAAAPAEAEADAEAPEATGTSATLEAAAAGDPGAKVAALRSAALRLSA
jgi:hypothetical protein